MSNFQFQAQVFVQHGDESAAGEWSDEDRAAIARLRDHYPELAHWGDLALGAAFGCFSEAFFSVAWAYWMLRQRDELFLDYCCWRQTRGEWHGGFDDVALSQAAEWRSGAR